MKKDILINMTIHDILKIEDRTEKVIAIHELCSQHYQNWTETERLLNAVIDMEEDVMNGGFAQYFENKEKEEQKDAHIGLEKIGANKSKELFEKAQVFYSNNDLDSIEDLDQEFFKYEDNIANLVIAYTEKHVEDFSK